ncbi:class I SAM-dependent methyltransferase [Magnetococcales bacterium HHB-1]
MDSPQLDNSPLQQILIEEAARSGGSISFFRFMSLALYHKTYGYYMKSASPIGREGDFITAPEISSLFGELLTLQWIQIWQHLGEPDAFTLIEAGGGSGKLAEDILSTAKRFPSFYQALQYEIIEKGSGLKKIQQKRLHAFLAEKKIRWCEDLRNHAKNSLVGAVFSNEFLDAFPVHWLKMTENGWQEIAGCWKNGAWQEILIPLSSDIDVKHLPSGTQGQHALGQRIEVPTLAMQWLQEAGAILKQGLLLTIDYGHTEKEMILSQRLEGTVACYYKHQREENPWQRPGEMDLTTQVDFSAVKRAGDQVGLSCLGFTTQSWFLMGLGILERLQQITQMEKIADCDKDRVKQAVMRLVLPEQMGETFKVLALGRGLDNLKLFGFQMNNQQKRL